MKNLLNLLILSIVLFGCQNQSSVEPENSNDNNVSNSSADINLNGARTSECVSMANNIENDWIFLSVDEEWQSSIEDQNYTSCAIEPVTLNDGTTGNVFLEIDSDDKIVNYAISNSLLSSVDTLDLKSQFFSNLNGNAPNPQGLPERCIGHNHAECMGKCPPKPPKNAPRNGHGWCAAGCMSITLACAAVIVASVF